MGCQSIAILTQNLTFTTQTYNSQGVPTDTDSLPTYKVYEDETGTEILSGTMAKLDDANTAGFYSEQIAITADNGFEVNKSYSIRIEAAISSYSVSKTYSFICLGESAVSVNTSNLLTTTARFKSYAGITTSDDDTLIGLLIARATNAIQRYCNRDFVSTTYREFHDGEGQSELNLKHYPVTAVSLLGIWRQDAFGIKNDSTDAYNAQVSVTTTGIQLQVQGGDNEDDTTLTLADYSTLSALFTAITALDKGWSILEYPEVKLWSPTELLPTRKGLQCFEEYAYPSLPDEPEDDFVTDTNSGTLKYYGRFPRGFQNITVRYTAGYSSIPADLEQICIDLAKAYYDARKASSVMKRERMGDYEYELGGSTSGESSMPSNIADRLGKWMSWV